MTSSTRLIGAALAIFASVLGLAAAAHSGPVILLEAASGRVLYAEDQDHQWFPASITKIMTAYITFGALRSGSLKLTDTLEVSEKAHVQVPSKIGLPVGTEIAVDVALRALIVKSANDVAIMLAEKIGGSEEGFVRLMNETAKRLGMTRTHFVNPNGLPVEGQVSTARDLARLARAAVLEFPEYNALWAMPEFQFGQQRLQSHNALLRTFEGADGIKTGFICDSGFNVVASATRDGQRLMAVVLGEPSGSDRNLRAASLLEHGFETSAWKAQFGAPTIDTMPIDPKAQVVRSVRQSVVAWNCNGKRPVRKIARRKPKGVAQKAAGPRKAPPSKQVATPRPTGERNAKAAPAAKPQPTTKQ